jgi:hypothetical protein
VLAAASVVGGSLVLVEQQFGGTVKWVGGSLAAARA